MIITINELEENKKYQVLVERRGGSFITFNKAYTKFMEVVRPSKEGEQAE